MVNVANKSHCFFWIFLNCSLINVPECFLTRASNCWEQAIFHLAIIHPIYLASFLCSHLTSQSSIELPIQPDSAPSIKASTHEFSYHSSQPSTGQSSIQPSNPPFVHLSCRPCIQQHFRLSSPSQYSHASAQSAIHPYIFRSVQPTSKPFI